MMGRIVGKALEDEMEEYLSQPTIILAWWENEIEKKTSFYISQILKTKTESFIIETLQHARCSKDTIEQVCSYISSLITSTSKEEEFKLNTSDLDYEEEELCKKFFDKKLTKEQIIDIVSRRRALEFFDIQKNSNFLPGDYREATRRVYMFLYNHGYDITKDKEARMKIWKLINPFS